MTDRERVQAMRDANWTPAVEYWKRRADEAERALEMAECRAFSAGYDAGKKDGREAAAAICDERGLKYPVPSIAATVADDCAEAIRATTPTGETA